MSVERATPDLYLRPNEPEPRAQIAIDPPNLTSTHGETSMDHADNGHHPPFYSISDRSLQDVQIYGHNSPTGFAEHTFPFGYAQQISTDLESHSVQSEGPLDLRMMPISHLAGTKSIALASSRPQIERQDSHLSVESVSSQQHDHVSTLLQQPAPPSKRVIRSSKHVGGNMHTQCREETRTSSDNVLEHRMEGENHWHRAVMHDAIHVELLRRAKLKSHYHVPPAKGLSPGDETAPVPGQEDWAFAREHRPLILFQLLEKVLIEPDYGSPFMHDDLRVLDPKGALMTRWEYVPDTCSTELEGFRIEAWTRMNPVITYRDLQARMMAGAKHKFKSGESAKRGLNGTSTFTQRAKRFRQRTFNVAWQGIRDDSKAIWKRLVKVLPKGCIDANSTYNHRDANAEEIKRMHIADDDPHAKGEDATNDAADIPFIMSARSSDPNLTRVRLRKRLRDTIVAADDHDDSPQPKRQNTASKNASLQTHQSVLRLHNRRVRQSHPSQNSELGLESRLENDHDESRIQKLAYDRVDNGHDSATHPIPKYLWIGSSSSPAPASPQGPQLLPVLGSGDQNSNDYEHHLDNPRFSNYHGLDPEQLYNPPHIPQYAIHASLGNSIRDVISPGPEHATLFDAQGFDLEFEGSENFPHGHSVWHNPKPTQPIEALGADEVVQDETQKGFAEVHLGLCKTYLIICLDNGVGTKCVVSANGKIASNKVDLEALYREITSVTTNPPPLKDRVGLSDYTSIDSDIDPEYTILLLPTQKTYVTICIEECTCHKANILEGNQTAWEEIDLAQIVKSISNLDENAENSHQPYKLQPSLLSDETQPYQCATTEAGLSPGIGFQHSDDEQVREGPGPLVSQSGHQEAGYLLPLNNMEDFHSSDYPGSASLTLYTPSEASAGPVEQHDSEHSESPERLSTLTSAINGEDHLTCPQGLLQDPFDDSSFGLENPIERASEPAYHINSARGEAERPLK